MRRHTKRRMVTCELVRLLSTETRCDCSFQQPANTKLGPDAKIHTHITPISPVRTSPQRSARRRRSVLISPPFNLCCNLCLTKGTVAKHYLSDRASFTATAKHWAQAYAQAPASKKQGGANGKQATDAEMAGLAEKDVVAFTDMGFERPKVVSHLTSGLFTSDRGVFGLGELNDSV